MSDPTLKSGDFTEFEILLRDFRATDLNFIKNSWLTSYQKSQRVGPLYYWQGQESLIDQILAAPQTRCKIACDKSLPDFVLGYVIVSAREDIVNPILHYAYTKATYRRKYIFSMLMRDFGTRPSEDLQVTHWTPYCEGLRARYRKLTFNDYPLKLSHA